jgi:hypothetical protein
MHPFEYQNKNPVCKIAKMILLEAGRFFETSHVYALRAPRRSDVNRNAILQPPVPPQQRKTCPLRLAQAAASLS